MTKVFPNNVSERLNSTPCSPDGNGDAAILTVWKKSLLLNCNGFTVFDGKGNLVFRVDNYLAGHKGEIVLMDAGGKPLLTIRRKRLSLGDNWLVYDGETAVNPRFLVRKQVNILNTKCLANVSSGSNSNNDNDEESGITCSSSSTSSKNLLYQIEGSYTQRCCAVLDKKRRRVAEIQRKESVGGMTFGLDVFRLVVQPEIDAPLAMALVILLDQMFGSSRRLSH
ncbi:protein LURP-one-related 8 [Corylus avellana]|uniref:protein LURP-one-related 8 n=1 Tax=Corylus avellana TaxID=13451 RepID=UPI001E219727|nr:protein LURP-one-related 8 [Corylus avellana]